MAAENFTTWSTGLSRAERSAAIHTAGPQPVYSSAKRSRERSHARLGKGSGCSHDIAVETQAVPGACERRSGKAKHGEKAGCSGYARLRSRLRGRSCGRLVARHCPSLVPIQHDRSLTLFVQLLARPKHHGLGCPPCVSLNQWRIRTSGSLWPAVFCDQTTPAPQLELANTLLFSPLRKL